jgi:dUTP pyrophosphatase
MTIKIRGFEVVADWARRVPGAEVILPRRSTTKAAGYDIFALTGGVLEPGDKMEFPTDVKVYMQDNEVFKLYPRSNQGIVYDVMLANTTGVIDADFYNNPKNDGGFTIVLRNLGPTPYIVNPGDRIAQGVFTPYLLADNERDEDLRIRTGGVGSTGK